MAKEKLNIKTEKVRNTDSFYAWEGETLILNILGTPNAKLDVIGKVKGNQLKVSVKAIPDDGKATEYMIGFLAKEFGVSKKDIEVVFGQFSIHKQLRIKNPKHLPEIIKRIS